MKKILIPVLIGLAFVAVSCEDKLDIPQKGVITPDLFYASDDDAEAALVNMYDNYIDNVAGTEGIDNPEQVILNYSADDIYAAGKNFTDHDAFRIFDEFKYDNASGTLFQAYQRYYFAIYHANLVISNFTTENRYQTAPKHESDVTKRCVAEARVMRAYLHMMVALIWNQPPVMDRVYDSEEPLPANDKTQEEVLQWVIDECQKAIASGYLPKRDGTADKNATGRMSVGFAQFIAGKAAVFKNDMATARKYLGDLIESGDYDLIPGSIYWTNFHVDGDGNAEKIFEPNFIQDPTFMSSRWAKGIMRDRWMVANVFDWRIKSLASTPAQCISDGWGGGAIQETFAEKFYNHDGDSPRRRACFLTEEEFLYEMDWNGSAVNNGTRAEKEKDPKRGINKDGLFGRGKYFEWKNMVYMTPPTILTKDTTGIEFHRDNVTCGMGDNSNQKNFLVARYAEALLLYAEACIGSADAAKGLDALQKVQKRSGSGKISTELTFENVMEEKQYELWFENCRFLDLGRWSKLGKVDLNAIYNTSGIHQNVPTVHDKFNEVDADGNKMSDKHELYVTHDPVPGTSDFVVGKHEYLPFPRDAKTSNPNLHDVLGWAK